MIPAASVFYQPDGIPAGQYPPANGIYLTAHFLRAILHVIIPEVIAPPAATGVDLRPGSCGDHSEIM
jgi:hypothetical protein